MKFSIVEVPLESYNGYMHEKRIDVPLNEKEAAALGAGFSELMEYIRTSVYGDYVENHRIAKDIVALRNPAHELERGTNQSQLHLEIARITGYFVEHMWPLVHQWNKTHIGEFPVIDIRTGQMRPLQHDELISMFMNTPFSEPYHAHAAVVEGITHRYLRRLDGMLESVQGAPQGEARIYMRFRDLMQASDFHRAKYDSSPTHQISAGFATGTLFSWALLGSMQSMYRNAYGQNIPDKITLDRLENAGERFVTSVARVWLDAFNVINDVLLVKDKAFPGKTVYTPVLQHVFLAGDAHSGFSFEVDEVGLKKILVEMKRKKNEDDLLHNPAMHTMCPALLAAPETIDGKSRKSAIAQLFGWSAAQARLHHKPFASLN